jgi:nucleotide-binding universal stress UspA family protein
MHVLVPVDDSDPSRKALALACETYPDARITALHVLEPMHGEPAMWLSDDQREEAAAEETEELFAETRATAEEYGVRLETESVYGTPARAAVAFAEEHDVDHVFVGSHGRTGASRVLLGSVAEGIVRRSPVPVTVAR